MKRMMVQLTEEQVKVLKELAEARKTSVSKLVRESVATYIVAAPKETTMEAKRRRALAFIEYIEENPEKFSDVDGRTDVSINHDKYLAEIYG